MHASPAATDSADGFAQTYAQARRKFLDAAQQLLLEVQSHEHPLTGSDGEPLALDAVRDGPLDASRLLIISSGCHGVEGFCGSGAQIALLRDPSWRRLAHQAGVAVLYLHALNPHGFSWWRRTTHENVDLNRNFIDFGRPLPANQAYEELSPLLLPEQWPPTWRNRWAVLRFVLVHGMKHAQAAVSSGQYAHPEGLFYGGTAATWSHIALRRILREHGRQAQRIGWIDVHSGLGRPGASELILACRGDAAAARARAWWGRNVTSTEDGSSSSARPSGAMFNAAGEECPQAEYTGMALEIGTVPKMKVLDALRADQWLQNHPETPPGRAQAIKKQVRDAFYIDAPWWKHAVIDRSGQVARQALRGLNT